MPEPVRIAEVLAQVGQFITQLGTLKQKLPLEKDREALHAIEQALIQAKTIADRVAVEYVQAMDVTFTDLQTNLDRLTAKLQQRQQQFANLAREPMPSLDHLSAPPSPTELPLPPVDLNLGQTLRKDLLEHLFGKETPPTTKPREGKDIWQDWK